MLLHFFCGSLNHRFKNEQHKSVKKKYLARQIKTKISHKKHLDTSESANCRLLKLN